MRVERGFRGLMPAMLVSFVRDCLVVCTDAEQGLTVD